MPRNPRELDKKKSSTYDLSLQADTKHGLVVLALFTISLVLLLAFVGWAGVWGDALAHALRLGLGWAAYAILLVLWILGYRLLVSTELRFKAIQTVGLVITALGFAGVLHSTVSTVEFWNFAARGAGGGYIGAGVLYPLSQALGKSGALVVLLAVTLAGILVLFETSLKVLLEFFKQSYNKEEDSSIVKPLREPEVRVMAAAPVLGGSKLTDLPLKNLFKSKSLASPVEVKTVRESKAKIVPKVEVPMDLLEPRLGNPTSGDINAIMQKIQRTLQNFGIDVEMGGVNVGPTVTQYTLAPAEGVKLSQITTLNNDLALALAAHPIRIEAPIPGQSLVGIEVPNQAVAMVGLREILESEEFKKRGSSVTVGIGKDVAGKPFVADIERMPHMLIAGATGSGKSVCINSIIISLLYSNSAEELKFIIVDPKRVELASYNDIPHLLTPVVTDSHKTINALKWIVGEMDRRYQVLSAAGKRNIQSFNQAGGERMPYLVVIIDELADLMAVAAADVEAAIIRLAQMARAVGIHLIVATQRPSVDVITGLIKANITSRIAFAVASATDSRTILDTSGAEKLLGRGDCLFISAELSKPKRLQGAFIGDAEIERVVSFVKQQGKPDYNPEIISKTSTSAVASSGLDGDDELLTEAKLEVIRAGKASASLLQRRLRVGYARAARLLDLLEEGGIIGPGDGAKPREVLVRREDLVQDFTTMPEEQAIEDEPIELDQETSKSRMYD